MKHKKTHFRISISQYTFSNIFLFRFEKKNLQNQLKLEMKLLKHFSTSKSTTEIEQFFRMKINIDFFGVSNFHLNFEWKNLEHVKFSV